jgi:hypothetical protein
MSHPYTKYENFRYGKNRPASHRWSAICVHWSAGHAFAKETADYINREKSGGWYNYVLDKDITIQTVDPLYKTAGHAGSPWNTQTIGICIAQPVVYLPGALKIGKDKYLDHMNKLHKKLKDRGYEVEIKEYESSRYPYVFSLDPSVSHAVADLSRSIAIEHNLPMLAVGTRNKGVIGASVTYKDERVGVVNHHHLTSRKFDCEPWMDSLNRSFSDQGFEIIL